jgi:hypothetical protein
VDAAVKNRGKNAAAKMWLFVRQLPKPKEVAFCIYIIKIVLKGNN